jgi:hypothetical protein
MKLRKSEVYYEMTDPSGYNFTVVCKHNVDPELGDCGWSAEVVMKTTGFKTPMDAVRHLKSSAEAFIRESKEIE